MASSDAQVSDFLTIEQVAAKVGKSAITVRRMLAAGTISASALPAFNRTMIHCTELAKIPAGRKKRMVRRKRGRRGP